PALATEVPHAGEEDVGVLRIHREARAARRETLALEDMRPPLASVGRLVDAAIRAVAPELAGNAGVDDVAVLRVNEDADDALRLGEPHVLPRRAAVGRLVDAVTDRHRVARPRLARADPHRVVTRRIDSDRANRLDLLVIEDRLERRRAVDRLPDATG